MQKFTLTYSGRLPSTSDGKRKHRIREYFQPQMKELWQRHPALSARQNLVDPAAPTTDDAESGRLITEVRGVKFAALVHPHLKLYAELDILLLRQQDPGALVAQTGDLDNQLKTLFDGLRRPLSESEVPKNWSCPDAAVPFHCLLDDDKYIYRVNVEADRLLMPVDDPQHVEITIRVSLGATAATYGNVGLLM